MKKVLFVASVVKIHIMVFHIPYLKWFKENGYEVHVAAKNDYEDSEELNIPYCDVFHNIDFSRSPLSRDNYMAYVQMKDILSNNEFEIMHCHTPIGAAISRLAAKNVNNQNMKIIYTAHGFHFFKGAPVLNWLLFYPTEYYLSKYTNTIITINNEDFERAKKMQFENVELVPGVGVDFSKVNQIINDPLIIKKEFNEGKKVLLSVGELNKNKNHRVVIEALSRLNRNDFQYIICGEGPERQNLQKLVKRLKLENRVQFLGFRTDVLEIYKISDIFIFPSKREGLSVSLMEAMAFGLPVLASNIRGNYDLIDEGLGGELVEPKDPEGLANKINKLLDKQSLMNSFGKYNRNKVQIYSIDNVLKQVTKIYYK